MSLNDIEVEQDLEAELIERARSDLLAFTLATKDDFSVNWHHRHMCEKLNKFLRGEILYLMVFMPPRHGKLIADSTEVLTSKGWSTHGELKVGDCVYHPSGEIVRVLETSKKINCNARVYFSDNSFIDCHENHEWNVYDRGLKKYVIKETKDLNKNKDKRCRYQLPKINELVFSEKDLIIDPYVLGAWLGDGTKKSPRITHNKNDHETIDEIVKRGYKISCTSVNKKTGVISTNFSGDRPNVSGKLWKGIKHYNLNKEKYIPNDYIYSSINQRLDLLAGMIDTDGCVEKEFGRVRIVNCNIKIINGLNEICKSLGFRTCVSKQVACKSSSGIVGKKDVYTLSFNPHINIPTKIKRKEIVRLIKRKSIGIKKVETIESNEFGQCIQVDSPDGLYLVGRNFIPTHNSELISRRFPAMYHGLYPDNQMMCVSYNDSLAGDMTTDVQKIIDSEMYQKIFPKTKILKPAQSYVKGTRNSLEHTIIGHRGIYRGQGVGGSFTGKGTNIISIDDPIKGREVADSTAFRERLWNFFNNDLLTRLENDLETGRRGQILITQTRWHESDLSGMLLDQMKKDSKAIQFEIIDFPAIKENNDNPDDPRQIGEALWPQKYNLKQLEQIKAAVGVRAWTSLFQQNPTPSEGGLLEERMFRFDSIPNENGFDYKFITADTSYKEKTENDFTVFSAWGVIKDQIYLIDVWRRQVKSSDVEKLIEPFIREHIRYGYRGTYIEPKGHGIYLNQAFASKGLMIPSEDQIKEFYSDRRFDKVERANNVIPHLSSRLVIINENISFKEDLVSECLHFPKGKHDDFVDTLIDALKMVYARQVSILDVL